MNISPVSNVKFGQYYHQEDFNDKQQQVVDKIETALKSPVPFDKEGRSYERYLDAMGYDIITWSAKEKENGVAVYVLRQPINEADKVRRAHCEFRCDDDDIVGTYDENHAFEINEIMDFYNKDQKELKKIKLSLLAMPFLYIAITLPLLWGISKIPGPKQKNPEVIEKAVQDTTKVAQDTLQLFKK